MESHVGHPSDDISVCHVLPHDYYKNVMGHLGFSAFEVSLVAVLFIYKEYTKIPFPWIEKESNKRLVLLTALKSLARQFLHKPLFWILPFTFS